MPARDKPSATPAATGGRDRTDAMLDEALGETFPASDPVAITPAWRDAYKGDAAAPDTANETPSVGGAAHDARQRASHAENRH